MFTFIKRLQELLSRLKKNKGIWFTTITLLSISGIVIFMFIIVTMTDRVSKQVYESMLGSYNLRITAKIDNKMEEFKKLSYVIYQDENLINLTTDGNKNSINAITDTINKNLTTNGHDLAINIFPTITATPYRNTINSVIANKKPIFGIEVLEDGIFIILLEPIQKDENLIGVLEIKESLHSLKNLLKKDGSEFIFLLNKKMLPSLSINEKTDNYKEIVPNNEYLFKQAIYDSKFANSINDTQKEIFDGLLQNRYTIDQNYFRVAHKVSDISGVDIGYVVAGENIEVSGGFVNIADDMTNTVTTVALGLVISIILFLF